MLGDLATQLAGDDIQVITLIVPGADPHIYRPTPGDAAKVSAARIVITNGLHLESWADGLIENAGDDLTNIVASRGVVPLNDPQFAGDVDPHFWFDVRQWKEAAARTAVSLAEEWPEHAEAITRREEAYSARLDALDVWVRESIASIPEAHRVLVTSHDAFNYFGEAYGIEVVGIQGISTESEPSQRDVVEVIERIRSSGAPAVFAETSVNPTLIERVSAETGVPVAGALYSDSVGPVGSGAETYEGMVVANVHLIVEGLGGTFTEFSP
ncbi:MAG: ABC-type Zn uptake system ZnuABC Zn-binding protein ZnuA, partial [Bradymonadia bacterium]